MALTALLVLVVVAPQEVVLALQTLVAVVVVLGLLVVMVVLAGKVSLSCVTQTLRQLQQL